MDERFCRNLPAITAREQAMLRHKRVLVVGCGGLGGYLCELVARLGVGHVRVVDGDVFSPGNLNRQLLCTTKTLGQNKAETARERLRTMDPTLDVEAFAVSLTADNARTLLEGCDVALDGLDNVEARLVLEQACAAAHIPLVHGAIAAWSAQAAVVPPGSGMLARLYAGAVPETVPSVLSFTAALCAAVQVQETTKLLCGRDVSLWGRLWLYDGRSGESHVVEL